MEGRVVEVGEEGREDGGIVVVGGGAERGGLMKKRSSVHTYYLHLYPVSKTGWKYVLPLLSLFSSCTSASSSVFVALSLATNTLCPSSCCCSRVQVLFQASQSTHFNFLGLQVFLCSIELGLQSCYLIRCTFILLPQCVYSCYLQLQFCVCCTEVLLQGYNLPSCFSIQSTRSFRRLNGFTGSPQTVYGKAMDRQASRRRVVIVPIVKGCSKVRSLHWLARCSLGAPL